MIKSKRIFLRDLGITIGSIAMCSLVAMLFKVFWEGTDLVSMAYILAVVLVSRMTQGYFWGILTSFLGVVAANFFFTYPYFYVNFLLPGYQVTFIIMLVISLTVSAVTAKSKVENISAKEREKRSESLNKLNREFTSCATARQVADATLAFMREQLDIEAYIYMSEGDLNKPYVINSVGEDKKLEHDRSIVYYSYVNAKMLIRNNVIYMPIMTEPDVYGVLVTKPEGDTINEARILLMEMTVNQAALAIKLTKVWEAQRISAMEAEKERTRNTMLRSISHDLRTPLTSIWGASATVLDNGKNMDEEEKYKLISDINDEARWLTQMVENLLATTKIDESNEVIKKSSEIVEEIIEEAVSRLKTRFPQGHINVKIPKEVLVAQIDQNLIKQVIINIVENAFKHGGYENHVAIELSKEGDMVKISIRDDGPGIPEEILTDLFSGKENTNVVIDSNRGYGLGLPICKSIIKAHGGNLVGKNIKERGLLVYFTLPLDMDSEI